MATTMGLTQITILSALALAMALVVERVIEILKALYDLADARADLSRFWTGRAIAIRDIVQRRLRALEYVEPSAIGSFLQKVDDLLLGPGHGYTGTVPTIAGDLVRAGAVRIGCKVIGSALGIWVAFTLDLNLFALFSEKSVNPTIGTLATGIAIGLGAGPTHKLITTLEKRRDKPATPAATNPEAARV